MYIGAEVLIEDTRNGADHQQMSANWSANKDRTAVGFVMEINKTRDKPFRVNYGQGSMVMSAWFRKDDLQRLLPP
jgi:hypothetical protein